MPQTIICMKWGTRYGADYVNRLYSMIQRHCTRPTRLVCFTEDASGINPAVEIHPLPPIDLPPHRMWHPWRKLAVWQEPLADLSGDVLFLDLDMVITGGLDDFFDYKPGHYCVARNWTQEHLRIGNTSIFRFPVGKHTYIYDNFMKHCDEIMAKYRIEQTYISYEITDMEFWPDDWCKSFKHSLVPSWPLNFFVTPPLPSATKVVAFTGKPDPDEAVIGQWPRGHWYHMFYKYVRPTPWIAEHWQ